MYDKVFIFQMFCLDIIIDGLFDLGMWVDFGFILLNSYENCVYQFQDEECYCYVVKFYCFECWFVEQIFEEYQFVFQFVEDEVFVVVLFLFNDSMFYQYQGFYFVVFLSFGGCQFEVDNFDQMEWVGCYLGCLYQMGCKQCFIVCLEIGVQEYLLELCQVFEQVMLIFFGLKVDFLKVIDKFIVVVME